MKTKINLSIPTELKKQMEEYPHINWSKVMELAIKNSIAMSDAFENQVNKQSLESST